MTEKVYITWNDLHQDTKKLAEKVKAKGSYNHIIAISRGGLVPAGILAYELDIQNTSVINLSSYENETQGDFNFQSLVNSCDEKTLIVDDLSDTGNSIRFLRKHYPSACYVTIYTKPQGKSESDIYAKEMPNLWLVFPWD